MGEVTKIKPSPKYGTSKKSVFGKSSCKRDVIPTSKPVSPARTSPSRRSHFQRLPNELLTMICRFLLEVTGKEKLQPTYAKDVRTALKINRLSLKAFASTCRSVRLTAQILLFQDVVLFKSKRSPHLRLLHTLEAYPHWQPVIRSVDLAWFPSLTLPMLEDGPPHASEDKSVAGKVSQAQALKRKLEPWFYKRVAESFFCDRSKTRLFPGWDDPRAPVLEVYEDNALCMMLLSQLPNLRSARIRLPTLDRKWRRHFDNLTLRWPSQNPRLTGLKELQLCPDSRHVEFTLFATTPILHGALSLETLVLINGKEPIISVPALKLPNLRSLVVRDCGLFLKPHLLRLLVRPCTQLRHFQIDFFDHKQTFNFGTNYARDVWERYFTPFEIDWQDPNPGRHHSRTTGATQSVLNRYCTVASNLLHALSHASPTLETLYLGQLSKNLDSTRASTGRIRIKLKRGVQLLSSFKAFPKLKRLCIDVRMIHQVCDSNKPDVLVDLIKDCPDLEALMLYGVDHVNLEGTGSFVSFARAVDDKETFPNLKKVVILADNYKGRDLDHSTRKLSALAGVWSRENKNEEVKLEFLMDDGLCG